MDKILHQNGAVMFGKVANQGMIRLQNRMIIMQRTEGLLFLIASILGIQEYAGHIRGNYLLDDIQEA